MSYKWKPSASQRKEFAIRMQNIDEKKAYEDRKYAKNHYNVNDSRSFANREFIPTGQQYKFSLSIVGEKSDIVECAINIVQSAFICQDKIHHKYIHIINAISRGEKNQMDIIFE